MLMTTHYILERLENWLHLSKLKGYGVQDAIEAVDTVCENSYLNSFYPHQDLYMLGQMVAVVSTTSSHDFYFCN